MVPFHEFCYSLSFFFVYSSCYFILPNSYFLLFLSSRLLFLPTNIQHWDDGPSCFTRSSHSGSSSHSGECCKLSISIYLCFIYFCLFLFIHFYLSIYLFVYLFIRMFTYLFTYLLIYLFLLSIFLVRSNIANF